MEPKIKFGIVGKNIAYSFSKKYFTEKFQKLNLSNCQYINFDIPEIEEFPFLLYHKKDEFKGLNVTIPYKESVIKYLDEIDVIAKKIGAVNTIKITEDERLVGYNTDTVGFVNSLKPLLQKHHNKALVLGTGGASKAIQYSLNQLNISYKTVSRKTSESTILYQDITKNLLDEYLIIINCTPLGTFPDIEEAPQIPYQFLTAKHLLYDLIYNPTETKFLKEGKKLGSVIKNGFEMLEIQAEKSWEIWNS